MKLVTLVAAWFRFIATLLSGKVGLVHAHTASRASFWRKSLFFVPAFMARVPVILHLHGAEFQVFYERECSALARGFVRWIFNRVSRVVVLSESWQCWIHSAFPAARAHLIHNPIFIPELSDSPRSSHTLLFLGRLGERKGTYDLLGAVARLVSTHPELRVLLAGDGEVDDVRRQAEALGIADHIVLPGWVRGEEKSRLLQEACIYVLPSYHEGLPMSVLEAMAYGLPVVSTPIGGIPDAVRDGQEGFLIAPGDVTALAERIGQLLADSELRARMGNAARARSVAHFGAAGIVERWIALYGELGMACPG